MLNALPVVTDRPFPSRARPATPEGNSPLGAQGRLLGRIAQVAIIAFAVIVAIDQVGIAADLVNTLFVGVVAAFAIGFGLAFGLGGRDVAAQITQKWYASTQETADRLKDRRASASRLRAFCCPGGSS
ncbi:MAG TPA: hypothetical protein VGQ58_03590 [Candidatus Limnocylindrales bacterium]|nr:hypothetical protein [Candidatus Limnocylindrales bacterium]